MQRPALTACIVGDRAQLQLTVQVASRQVASHAMLELMWRTGYSVSNRKIGHLGFSWRQHPALAVLILKHFCIEANALCALTVSTLSFVRSEPSTRASAPALPAGFVSVSSPSVATLCCARAGPTPHSGSFRPAGHYSDSHTEYDAEVGW